MTNDDLPHNWKSGCASTCCGCHRNTNYVIHNTLYAMVIYKFTLSAPWIDVDRLQVTDRSRNMCIINLVCLSGLGNQAKTDYYF